MQKYCFIFSPISLYHIDDLSCFHGYQDDELREMITSADAMATSSAHYISHVLTNELLATAGESLVNVIGRVGAEPQWIPTAWLTGDKGLTEDGDQGLTDETQGATSQGAQGVN